MAFTRLMICASGLALIAGCGPSRDTADTPANDQTENEATASPIAPVVPKALGRSDLLLAMGKVASAFALGKDDIADQRALDGQIFEFRMRYGCTSVGQGSTIEPLSVSFDEENRTLRLSAHPGVTMADATIAAVTHGQVEAVEGFWIDRPWLLEAGCPRPRAQVPRPETQGAGSEADQAPTQAAPVNPPVTVPTARFAIAQFFGEEESRTLRRNSRPYQLTKTLAEGVTPSSAGYDIVLAGRLRKLPDGRVISCTTTDPVAGPSCVVSVAFDRVSIRRGDNDELLSEWGSG